jgi:hypothetical protein
MPRLHSNNTYLRYPTIYQIASIVKACGTADHKISPYGAEQILGVARTRIFRPKLHSYGYVWGSKVLAEIFDDPNNDMCMYYRTQGFTYEQVWRLINFSHQQGYKTKHNKSTLTILNELGCFGNFNFIPLPTYHVPKTRIKPRGCDAEYKLTTVNFVLSELAPSMGDLKQHNLNVIINETMPAAISIPLQSGFLQLYERDKLTKQLWKFLM